MSDIETYIAAFKIVWPIALWVAWVNHTVKRNERDLNYLFWVMRGKKKGGLRKAGMRANLRRTYHDMRMSYGKPNGGPAGQTSKKASD